MDKISSFCSSHSRKIFMLPSYLNPIALRKAKIVYNFGLFECKRVESIHYLLVFFSQELESLCEGLEGRSSNPVAVLFDALCHPDADLGADNPSVLEWKFEEEHAINHIVLGKLRPGGAWQVFIMIFSLKCLNTSKER